MSRSTFIAAAAAAAVAFPAMAGASTIGYYRFGDDTSTTASSAFLADSSGNGYHLSQGGSSTATQYTLPAVGPGSDFSDPIPGTGASNDYALSTGSKPYLVYNPSGTSPFANVTDFTVEGYFNLTASSSSTQYLVSEWVAQDNRRSWAIGVASSGGTASASANELFALLSTSGENSVVVPLGLVVNPGDDYYFAFTYDADAEQEIGVYAQNLSQGDALPSSPNSINGVGPLHSENVTSLEIGAYSAQSSNFGGILDEIRISSGVLDRSELLNVIPEPTSMATLLGGALMLVRRRRS